MVQEGYPISVYLVYLGLQGRVSGQECQRLDTNSMAIMANSTNMTGQIVILVLILILLVLRQTPTRQS